MIGSSCSTALHSRITGLLTGDPSQAREGGHRYERPPPGGRLLGFSTRGPWKGTLLPGLAVPGLRRRKFSEFLAYCHQKKLAGGVQPPGTAGVLAGPLT